MKALVLASDHNLVLVDRPVPVCAAPDDVVVQVRQTGICGTDRGVLLGKFHAEVGVVMGHEAVGTVQEVGTAVKSVRPGDRVIVNPTLYCGHCTRCRVGELNFCLHKSGNEIGIDRDGSFAEFLRIEERFLHRIPDDMDFDRAVLVEPLACVLNNVEAARLRTGDSVIVLGGGPIGLTAAIVVAHYGCPVTLVEPHAMRREAAEKIFSEIDGGSRLMSAAGSASDITAKIVIDAVGNLLQTGFECVEDTGTIVIMGFDERAEIVVQPLRILQRGVTIVGAGDYNSLIFPRAIELARYLPLEQLITHRFALDDFHAALAAVGAGSDREYSGLKVVIEGAVRNASPAELPVG